MKKKNVISSNYFEAIIVGGSYAGLSAAMALGRSLRKVLIIDHGAPCNKSTPHSHNFLTQDGKTPSDIAELSREQVLAYDTVELKNDLVVSCKPSENQFEIATRSGEVFYAKKILFASGIKDLIPDIEGLAACWGKSVIHCPYCHGYEYRHKKTGILADGEAAMHHAQLVSNLTDELSLFVNGRTNFFTKEQSELLKTNNIKIIERTIKEIRHQDGYIEHIVLEDNSSIEIDALYARLPFEQHCKVPEKMGCEINEQGFISVNNFQETNIRGIFAAGDNSSGMRSVANAVATGNLAGAMINMQLCEEKFI